MEVGELAASLTSLGSTVVGEWLKEHSGLLRGVDGSIAAARLLR